MNLVEEYRSYAQLCRSMIQSMHGDENKQLLLELTEAWEEVSREASQLPSYYAAPKSGSVARESLLRGTRSADWEP
jgi:hypothetical protein